MNELLLKRLLTGDKEAVELFGESDNCAVIDWRAGVPEIVEAIAQFLPPGYLRSEQTGPTSFLLHTGGRASQPIEAHPQAKQETLISLVNASLSPEFELRQYRPCDGDSHSLYVVTTAVWAEIERSNPQAVDKFFLSAARLAAFWQKGFLSRLFSKP